MKKITALVLLLALAISATAQPYSSSSRKAVKLYQEARQNYRLHYFPKSEELLQKAIDKDEQFVEAYLLLAEVYHKMQKTEKEFETYQKAISVNRDFFPKAMLFAAQSGFSIGKYKESLDYLEKFLSFEKISEKDKKVAQHWLRKARFAVWAVENPVPFEPQNIGENVNSQFDEYWPSLTIDEQTLIFTRSDIKNRTQEDFFASQKAAGNWQPAYNLGAPVNTAGNEGAQAVSADGQQIFYTFCTCPDGLERCCDIYVTQKNGQRWIRPRPVRGKLNSKHWDAQPSISADGQALYFVSNRPGGKGGKDIWISHRTPYGEWSTPQNAGDSINTPGNESSPFIHPDNQSLYFASDFLPGMGGFDMFLARKTDDGNWTTPKNLGYPINTFHNENGLIVNAKGELAFFASDRLGKHNKDIYAFPLATQTKPKPVTFVKGIVYDAKTKQKLRAKFELIELESEKTLFTSFSSPQTGDFLVALPLNKNYALNVHRKGYLFYSENFSLEGIDTTKPYRLDVPLQPILVGQRTVLKNIFFETASYQLKPESNAELNKLVAFLKQNPELNIEIGGHTDNEGTKKYNQQLSENRAKAVYQYLIEHSIGPERLSYKGYDFSQPIATNETPQGRALNRRTEFKIVE